MSRSIRFGDLMPRIEEAAARERRTVSGWVKWVLSRYLNGELVEKGGV